MYNFRAHVWNDFFYDYDGEWYPGMDGAYVFPTSVLQLRKNPRKSSTRNTDSTGDRTRATWWEATIFIHQLLHVPPEEEIQTRDVKWPGVWHHCGNRNLVARITVAAGTIADMPRIFEWTRQSVVRRCTACIQSNCRAFERMFRNILYIDCQKEIWNLRQYATIINIKNYFLEFIYKRLK